MTSTRLSGTVDEVEQLGPVDAVLKSRGEPLTARARSGFTLRLDDGRTIRVETRGATLETKESAEAKGSWAEVREHPVAKVFQQHPGLHVGVELLARRLQVGDRVDVEGALRTEPGEGDFRAHQGKEVLSATRIAAQRSGAGWRNTSPRWGWLALAALGAFATLLGAFMVELSAFGFFVLIVWASAWFSVGWSAVRRTFGCPHIGEDGLMWTWLPQFATVAAAPRDTSSSGATGGRAALTFVMLLLSGFGLLVASGLPLLGGLFAGVAMLLALARGLTEPRDADGVQAARLALRGAPGLAHIEGRVEGAGLSRSVHMKATRYGGPRGGSTHWTIREGWDAPRTLAVTGGAAPVVMVDLDRAGVATDQHRVRKEHPIHDHEWLVEKGDAVLVVGSRKDGRIVGTGPASVLVVATRGGSPRTFLRTRLAAFYVGRAAAVLSFLLASAAALSSLVF